MKCWVFCVWLLALTLETNGENCKNQDTSVIPFFRNTQLKVKVKLEFKQEKYNIINKTVFRTNKTLQLSEHKDKYKGVTLVPSAAEGPQNKTLVFEHNIVSGDDGTRFYVALRKKDQSYCNPKFVFEIKFRNRDQERSDNITSECIKMKEVKFDALDCKDINLKLLLTPSGYDADKNNKWPLQIEKQYKLHCKNNIQMHPFAFLQVNTDDSTNSLENDTYTFNMTAAMSNTPMYCTEQFAVYDNDGNKTEMAEIAKSKTTCILERREPKSQESPWCLRSANETSVKVLDQGKEIENVTYKANHTLVCRARNVPREHCALHWHYGADNGSTHDIIKGIKFESYKLKLTNPVLQHASCHLRCSGKDTRYQNIRILPTTADSKTSTSTGASSPEQNNKSTDEGAPSPEQNDERTNEGTSLGTIVGIVLPLLLLLLCGLVFVAHRVKKKRRTKDHATPAAYAVTYGTRTNNVNDDAELYADPKYEFLKKNIKVNDGEISYADLQPMEPSAKEIEERIPYAQIIGVLKPKKQENVGK